ncbi:branched-chain amino acid ABC transporter permease [Variovorax defluvii]|uniref:Branched-chain amino acid ABC transporter permease n=1 Tax=Variovorax defluvii TaxID=913761 RepID=A0ABP8GW54_9BURK
MKWQLLAQFLVNGLVIGSLYGLVAMSFVLVFKASRVVNFAQGEFLLVGAWTCWWLLQSYKLPFALSFLIVMCGMTVLGLLIQVVVLRPLVGQPIISVIMVTIGMSVFLQAVTKLVFGSTAQTYPDLLEDKTTVVMGMAFETIYIVSALVAVAAMAVFGWLFKYTKVGLAMRATAFDQQVAGSLGIPVRNMFAVSWVISAVVSGFAGIVVGAVSGVSSGLSSIGLKVFPAVILGGMDSIVGAIVGGILVGLIENLAEFADGQFLHWGNLFTIVPFYVLVAVLMVRPYGLFGTRAIERV